MSVAVAQNFQQNSPERARAMSDTLEGYVYAILGLKVLLFQLSHITWYGL